MIMNKQKFLLDSILNIMSSALPLLVLQLFSLPITAKMVGSDNFGILITVISIITVIGFPVGNSLNNIRLLRNGEYIKQEITGDFNLLLLGSSFISSLCLLLVSISLEGIQFLNIILLVLIVIITIIKEYLVVSYRINLNFQSILHNNILLSIGYFIGTCLFYVTGLWEFIYLTGLVSSLVYLIFTTNLLNEPYNKTRIFNRTFKEFIILYGSGLLSNLSNYADKIILLPLLGPKYVSIYYAASILGKIISMFINPINSVILSYIAKIDRINQKVFLKGILLVSIIGLIGYCTTILISPVFLQIFYPILAEESLNIIYFTSATAILSILSSIFGPFNLRYNKLKWQIYMSSSNLIFYISLAYYLTGSFGLRGFTIAVLLSALYKFLFQVYIFLLVLKK
ncbi:lipopolysaccharide biosynthesis protein [Psychrobacillus sp. NPDC058041]|uniref:lipopolysaccharide biosynthesis protein n=1 Tax=Psychrobacillus sp. NPDC058041 TaxID=3346310 RepID=UPI0036DB2166